MSTEDYNRRGFPFGSLIFKIILIIIFVLLLCWLLPKFMVPAITKSTNGKGCNATCDCASSKALSSQIFANNLDKMKEAAISYYTNERLPQEVGQSKKLTLSDMIGLKIITPLIDKNNKAVNVEKSYVKITKTNDEYILKVNIKDSEKEDYILVHIGCYNYCESYVCQKKDSTDVPVKAGKEEKIEVPEAKHYCVKYNGKYFDINGTEVSYENYKKSCIPEERHYCVKYDGKYYDNNGKEVSFDEYKKACFKEEIHICVKYNNQYYDKTGKVVSLSEYKESCENKKDYLYEYKKTKEAQFSEWSLWSAWEKTDCNTEEINCNDNDETCLLKLQRYDRKEKIGTYEKAYARSREVVKQTGSYTEKTCSNYNYVIINNTIYTTTTKYTQTNVINAGTQATVGAWNFLGRQLFTNPPRDTATRHYKFAGADYSYCSDTCTTLPNYYYDVYEYTGNLTQTSSITKESTTTTSETTTIDPSCGSFEEKIIPIYSTITVTEKAYRTEPLYGDVCYKSTKTREIITLGKYYYKWSTYNDTSLLNNGWSYSGKIKEK